jgi:hypothetical protein
LLISEEEKTMLEEEGHFLPTNVALTKVSSFSFIFGSEVENVNLGLGFKISCKILQ